MALHPPSVPFMSSTSAPESPQPVSPTSRLAALTSPRSRRQATLFFAGASFFALSIVVTRRSILRKRLATFPTFYRPSNLPPEKPINGALEALEALNVATVNVASFMMMMTGGLLWAFDISGMEELKRKVRGGLEVDGSGRGEAEVEEEWEEWLPTVVERKREKEKRRKGREGDGDRDVDVEGMERRNERGKPR